MNSAKKYIVNAQKFINDKLSQSNYLYGEIFLEYRRIWLQLDNQTFIRAIETDFDSIKVLFNNTVDKTKEANFHSFNNINKILYILYNIVIELISFLKSKKNYPDSHRLSLYTSIIQLLLQEIKKYPESIL